MDNGSSYIIKVVKIHNRIRLLHCMLRKDQVEIQTTSTDCYVDASHTKIATMITRDSHSCILNSEDSLNRRVNFLMLPSKFGLYVVLKYLLMFKLESFE